MNLRSLCLSILLLNLAVTALPGQSCNRSKADRKFLEKKLQTITKGHEWRLQEISCGFKIVYYADVMYGSSLSQTQSPYDNEFDIPGEAAVYFILLKKVSPSKLKRLQEHNQMVIQSLRSGAPKSKTHIMDDKKFYPLLFENLTVLPDHRLKGKATLLIFTAEPSRYANSIQEEDISLQIQTFLILANLIFPPIENSQDYWGKMRAPFMH